MYINASITKECWEPAYNEIDIGFQNANYSKMRGIPVYKTPGRHGDIYYVAGEPSGADKIVVHGWVNVRKKAHWKCWTVDQSFVFPNSRSQGWGKLLYDTLINREKLILASGFEQSRTGRRMWKSMVKSGRYTIWAHDFTDPKSFAPVVYNEDDNTVESQLKLYEKWSYTWGNPRADIRLIAVKKG